MELGSALGDPVLPRSLDPNVPRMSNHLFGGEELLYRESESYVSHYKTSKHQCTRLCSVPNLNSQASSPFCSSPKQS